MSMYGSMQYVCVYGTVYMCTMYNGMRMYDVCMYAVYAVYNQIVYTVYRIYRTGIIYIEYEYVCTDKQCEYSV